MGRHHHPDMRILVTGASGFVGSTLIPRLLGDGHELRALARDPSRVPDLRAREEISDGPGALAWRRQPPPAMLDVPPARLRSRAAPGIHHPNTPIPPSISSRALTADFEGAPAGDLGAHVEVVRGDVLTGAGLTHALRGVQVAYYLIHSMERTGSRALTGASTFSTSPFPVRERQAAENFAQAARRAGVARIVYLGGLLPRERPASPHLSSRHAVEEILMQAVPDSVALRASIVIGARSRSFRFLVRLVERLPVIALPGWRRFSTQPIDERDVIEMLCAAASEPRVGGRSLDVGGPEAMTYGAMIQRIAELMIVGRPAIGLPGGSPSIAARIVAAIAGEDPELILPLMEGLTADLLPAEDHAAELLQVRVHSFDAAVEHALREWETFEPLAAR
jgi:uncharacterized protein YbjT (DUF2867 family)